ncbi:uncharacterized protein LOC108202628 isoform X5 [Daucus carota subsp. sativus]|uniref:uncharacterized protein LOC108202628 isoform X5 n=1 Tax=Daucus carota subsp. sativus TaxID=79200 RepID=UPI0030830AA2
MSTTPTGSSSAAGSWFSGIVRGRFDKSSTSPKMANNSAEFTGTNVGPVNKKKQFQGVMFKYGPKSIQVAFKTGDYKQQAIFIGGLTDGFLATDYLEPLAIALDKEKWSLVQFLLSSSYTGYGLSSLKEVKYNYLYVMDRILCITCGRILHVLEQSAEPFYRKHMEIEDFPACFSPFGRAQRRRSIFSLEEE